MKFSTQLFRASMLALTIAGSGKLVFAAGEITPTPRMHTRRNGTDSSCYSAIVRSIRVEKTCTIILQREIQLKVAELEQITRVFETKIRELKGELLSLEDYTSLEQEAPIDAGTDIRLARLEIQRDDLSRQLIHKKRRYKQTLQELNKFQTLLIEIRGLAPLAQTSIYQSSPPMLFTVVWWLTTPLQNIFGYFTR